MSLELLNTVGTLLTLAIVSATAIAALIQLRHLRAGNQINALLAIGDKFQDPVFREARYAVDSRLAHALDEQAFRDLVVARQRGKPLANSFPEQVALNQATLLVGNTYEEVGNLVKNGVIDELLFLDQYCFNVAGAWRVLEDYTAFCRETANDIGLWDNFEYLTVRAREFLEKHPTTYPGGVSRIALKSRWPVPAPSSSLERS